MDNIGERAGKLSDGMEPIAKEKQASNPAPYRLAATR